MSESELRKPAILEKKKVAKGSWTTLQDFKFLKITLNKINDKYLLLLILPT